MISRRWLSVVAALVTLALTIVLFLSPSTRLNGVSASSNAALGTWSCDTSQKASMAFKVYPWSNSTALVASALPEPAAMQVDNDFTHRAWHLWLYPPGDVYTFFWDETTIESTQPGGLAGGKVNPTGNPAPFYHDGFTKSNMVQWDPFGGPGALYRVRFPCTYKLP